MKDQFIKHVEYKLTVILFTFAKLFLSYEHPVIPVLILLLIWHNVSLSSCFMIGFCDASLVSFLPVIMLACYNCRLCYITSLPIVIMQL